MQTPRVLPPKDVITIFPLFDGIIHVVYVGCLSVGWPVVLFPRQQQEQNSKAVRTVGFKSGHRDRINLAGTGIPTWYVERR